MSLWNTDWIRSSMNIEWLMIEYWKVKFWLFYLNLG